MTLRLRETPDDEKRKPGQFHIFTPCAKGGPAYLRAMPRIKHPGGGEAGDLCPKARLARREGQGPAAFGLVGRLRFSQGRFFRPPAGVSWSGVRESTRTHVRKRPGRRLCCRRDVIRTGRGPDGEARAICYRASFADRRGRGNMAGEQGRSVGCVCWHRRGGLQRGRANSRTGWRAEGGMRWTRNKARTESRQFWASLGGPQFPRNV